jgi:YkoY family integral membrane protein
MIDRFFELYPQIQFDGVFIVLILIALEAVLSADNAIALAALVKGLDDPQQQQRALNLGLVAAFGMRMALIFTATWVIQFWQFELMGAGYLLWLAIQYFRSADSEDDHHGPQFASLWQAIPVIAVTDLAFSLDSVTTAIALSDNRWLVVAGGIIGIMTLRFMAGLFIHWLEIYIHLQDAGYVTVALVGVRLLVKVFNDSLVPPQWVMLVAIAAIFTWGFSKRKPVVAEAELSTEAEQRPEASEELRTLISELSDRTQEEPQAVNEKV